MKIRVSYCLCRSLGGGGGGCGRISPPLEQVRAGVVREAGLRCSPRRLVLWCAPSVEGYKGGVGGRWKRTVRAPLLTRIVEGPRRIITEDGSR